MWKWSRKTTVVWKDVGQSAALQMHADIDPYGGLIVTVVTVGAFRLFSVALLFLQGRRVHLKLFGSSCSFLCFSCIRCEFGLPFLPAGSDPEDGCHTRAIKAAG